MAPKDDGLKVNLKVNLDEENKKKKERAKKAQETKDIVITEADWEDAFSRKNTKADLRRLREVKQAYQAGKVFPQKKFSKAEALRMWKRWNEIRREDRIKEMVENTPDNYFLIQDTFQMNRLIKYLEQEPIIAVDTETTGLDIFGEDTLVGISLTLPKVDFHYYIPIHHDEGQQLPEDVVLNRLRPFLEDPNVGKVLHNATFDMHILKRHGVRLRGVAGDTQVRMWLLMETEPTYRLKDLATKWLKEPSDTFDELFGKNTKFNTIPLDVALVYAGKDTDITWRLYQFQEKHLSKDKLSKVKKLYEDIENPIIDVCFEMEETGFVMDMKYANEYDKILNDELKEVNKELYKHFPKDMNFNSWQQLQKVLYDDWGLPDVSGSKSTDADTLERLDHETDHDGLKALLKYREITKLIGTYIEKLPKERKYDDRVHGRFNQMGTATGRFSSSSPNLQNIPYEARKLFIAPDGWLIIGSDYSQIEPRVLSHLSGDKHLREPYQNGGDLYSTLASRVFKKPYEECIDNEAEGYKSPYRKMMKTGLLAVMYGTSMWTLSKQLGISVEEAEKFIDDFFEEYPKVAEWIKGVHEFVKENEYVETMFGRKRRFQGHRQEAIAYDNLAEQICDILGTNKVPLNIWDNKYKKILPYQLKRKFQNVKGSVERVRRQAVNAIIQGSSADIMKLAMIAVYKEAQEQGYKMLATVHDEILLYVPEDITLEQVEGIEKAMTGVVDLSVPFKVDVMFTKKWGENERPKDDWFGIAC